MVFSGCRSYAPLVHSVNPHSLVGFSPVNTNSVDLDIHWWKSRRRFRHATRR
jgi:hypothetical protein